MRTRAPSRQLGVVRISRFMPECSSVIRSVPKGQLNALRENFASASRCPDRTLVISGHAFDNERNAQDLALDRARAVMQYYLNLGLAPGNVRLGRAVVHQRATWDTEVWRGRRATTQLDRRTGN
ncbi:MAG: hypothetical protein ACPGQT_08170 [Rhodothermales bacterium]